MNHQSWKRGDILRGSSSGVLVIFIRHCRFEWAFIGEYEDGTHEVTFHLLNFSLARSHDVAMLRLRIAARESTECSK